MTVDPRELARWARIVTSNRLVCLGPDWRNTGRGGSTFGGAAFCTPTARLADAIEEVSTMQRDLLTTTPTPRRPAIPLLVELCAGTAALSLRLERAGARPPVSRMGAKTGYADCILALAGLEPGDMAGHYLWCEPDDGVRLLLHAYRDADLAREAARIIRCWADEEPRALWERLRAEGPARCPPVDAREVARWTWYFGRSFNGTGTAFRPSESSKGTPVWNAHPPQHFAAAVVNTTGLPATIHDDATTAPIPDPLPEGTLVFIDPPYVGTTGYAHDLDRPAVVRLAQQWAAAGARVMISEAVPIDALVACGWHAVEVSAMRVGQKRTFSKQQREWVTTSFEPDRRAVRACELAAERAERAAAVMAGGEQRDLFGVPEVGNRSRGGGWQSATALPTPSTGDLVGGDS